METQLDKLKCSKGMVGVGMVPNSDDSVFNI